MYKKSSTWVEDFLVFCPASRQVSPIPAGFSVPGLPSFSRSAFLFPAGFSVSADFPVSGRSPRFRPASSGSGFSEVASIRLCCSGMHSRFLQAFLFFFPPPPSGPVRWADARNPPVHPFLPGLRVRSRSRNSDCRCCEAVYAPGRRDRRSRAADGECARRRPPTSNSDSSSVFRRNGIRRGTARAA